MSEAGAASRFAWGVADLVPLRAKRRTVRLAAGAAAEFACHSKACAPPPVGAGGSTGGSTGRLGLAPHVPGRWAEAEADLSRRLSSAMDE